MSDAEHKVMRVSRGDLAALSFHVKDLINDSTAYLEGRELGEGETVSVTVRTTITRTERGTLIFGAFKGEAAHG